MKIEEFIATNRDQFDDQEPSEELWSRIRKDAGKKQRLNLNYYVWRAAAVFFLITSLALSWIVFSGRNSEENMMMTADFQRTEQYYLTRIDRSKAEIQALDIDSSGKKELFSAIDALDSAYLSLKREYKKTGREDLVNELIYNLQIRIEILQSQVELISSIKKSKGNEEHIGI